MLKRKIERELISWKNNPNKMVLLVKGARQVGKTFIIDKFEKNISYREFFDGDLDTD